MLDRHAKRRMILAGVILGACLGLLAFALHMAAPERIPIPFRLSKVHNRPPDSLPSPLSNELSAKPLDALGVDVTDIQEADVRQLHLQSRSGVLIKRVRRPSAAEEAGLQPADVLHAINKTRIESVRDYRRALKGAQKTGIMEVRIERRGTPLEVSIAMTRPGD